MIRDFILMSFVFHMIAAVQAIAAPHPVVFVSILPQKYFVQQISKDTILVEVMVQPGASPATYEPKPSQMKKLAEAMVYFAIGVPFENSWLEKIKSLNPKMEVVHTDSGINKLRMKAHSHNGGQEGEREGEVHDEQAGLDPHIWLSPPLVKRQAIVITETLSKLFPDHALFYKKNLSVFLQQLDGLDKQLRSAFNEKKERSFMVFHPSWGYFAHEYGLDQVAVEIEGKNPKPAQIRELIGIAKMSRIRVIFVQPQFSRKSAQLIANEIDGEVLSLDPLAENWYENMKLVSEKLKSSMK